MKSFIATLAVALCLASCAAFKTGAGGVYPPKTLDIYFLDMMGGASTLIVTPLGESFLIDTGSLEPKNRDADRIYRATQCADLKQIDCLEVAGKSG